MKDQREFLFEEKQRIGFNRFTLSFRITLAAFCFIAYYFTEGREVNGALLFVLGFSIMFISILMFFVIHLHTKILPGMMELDGLWSTKKVKIDLHNIVNAEKTRYSKYHFNSPTYNLHFKGTIRFYTSGTDAIKLTDKDGMFYLIGSQRADEFLKIINNQLSIKN